MGIYAGGGYGSRGPEKPVMGMRPWGYMKGEAMEVGVPRSLSWEGGHVDIYIGGTRRKEKDEGGAGSRVLRRLDPCRYRILTEGGSLWGNAQARL